MATEVGEGVEMAGTPLRADVISLLGLPRPVAAPELAPGALSLSPDRHSTAAARLLSKGVGIGGSPALDPPGSASWPAS